MKKRVIVPVVMVAIVAVAGVAADRLAQAWAVRQVDALVARPDIGGSHGAVT